MSTTLTYGLKRPGTGDKGSVWFSNLEDNITQLDGHNHNGSNSAKLGSASLSVTTADLSSGDWSAVSGKAGLFSQAVTMPVGFDYDEYIISFRGSSGDSLFLDTEKISDGSYTVYCNDSSIDVKAYYGV